MKYVLPLEGGWVCLYKKRKKAEYSIGIKYFIYYVYCKFYLYIFVSRI